METGIRDSLERYGIALAAAAAGVLLRILLTPLIGSQTPFITLFPAVAVAALYAGFRAGLVTTVLGAAAVEMLIMQPVLAVDLSRPEDVTQLVLFLVMGGFISWVAADRRRARSELKQTEIEALEKTEAAVTALRESEERLSVAQSSLGVGVWDWDLTTDKIAWSEGIYTLLGTGPGAVDSTLETWKDFILPEDQETAMSSIRELIDEGSPNFYGEFRIRRRSDGKIRWVATQGRIIRDGDKAVRLLGVNFDITETKDTELRIQSLNRELNRRVRELQTIIELTPVGLAVATDASCDVITANPALAKLIGVEPGDNVSMNRQSLPYRHLKDGRELKSWELPMQRAIEERRPVVDEEIDIELADGTIVSVYGYAAPVFDDDDNVIGCVAAQIDVTDRKKYEQERERAFSEEKELRREAEEASRLKDEFLATVSHELRTPLNSITGWAALLGDPTLSEDSQRRAVEAIERGARVQSQLIEDLLDVSRIVSGKLHLNRGPVDVDAVIRAAAETVMPAAEAKSIDISIETDQETGLITGDADRLQQIAWNLLSNAVKFTPEGGRVNIGASRKGSRVDIVVTDTGKGIREEFLPYVFDRFRQADGSITRKYSGLGLGLAIVRHLVELHGGTVEVASEGEGRGSTFTVCLPAGAPTNGHRPDVRTYDDDVSLEGVSVLLVEDEDDTREVLKMMFERCGASVRAAGSAGEALEIVRTSAPTVIVSDIGMPERDGYALMRDIRAWESQAAREPIPSIALTAYARQIDRENAEAAGYQMHIAKPVEPTELVRRVRSALESAESTEIHPSASGRN